MVDDSHAVGFMGPTGRGTPEHFGVADRMIFSPEPWEKRSAEQVEVTPVAENL